MKGVANNMKIEEAKNYWDKEKRLVAKHGEDSGTSQWSTQRELTV